MQLYLQRDETPKEWKYHIFALPSAVLVKIYRLCLCSALPVQEPTTSILHGLLQLYRSACFPWHLSPLQRHAVQLQRVC